MVRTMAEETLTDKVAIWVLIFGLPLAISVFVVYFKLKMAIATCKKWLGLIEPTH